MSEDFCILDSEKREKEERLPVTIHVLFKRDNGPFFLDKGEEPEYFNLHKPIKGTHLGYNIAHVYNYIMEQGLVEMNESEMPPFLRRVIDLQCQDKARHVAVFMKLQEKK